MTRILSSAPFRTLFILLVSIAASAPVAFSQSTDDTIRVETNLVSVPVVVSDRQGRYVTGLKSADFTVIVDGKEVETAFFASENEPLRVAVLLDTSKSTDAILGKIKRAAREFVKTLAAGDSAAIITFDYDVHLLQPLTGDRKLLERAINEIEIGEYPGTVMRDALLETVTKQLNGAKGRKAIILLTDGKDFGSDTYAAELERALEESDSMIYPIFFETTMPGRNIPIRRRMRDDFPRRRPNEDRVRRREAAQNERAREILERYALLTGGRFIDKKDNDLNDIFAVIGSELRSQYRLGFYPDESVDSTIPKAIKVKVNRTDIAIRSRSSFRLKR